MGEGTRINMKLIHVISNINSFDEAETIYVQKPWNVHSDSIVIQEPEDGSIPIQAQGKDYFLEVFLVKEFLEDWLEGKTKKADEICSRIIQYATDDA